MNEQNGSRLTDGGRKCVCVCVCKYPYVVHHHNQGSLSWSPLPLQGVAIHTRIPPESKFAYQNTLVP